MSTVVVRPLTALERATHALAPVPVPCAVGQEILGRMATTLGNHARTPTARIPARLQRVGRALGREWRAHFLACPACYDVWTHDSATHGVKVLQPFRPEVTP